MCPVSTAYMLLQLALTCPVQHGDVAGESPRVVLLSFPWKGVDAVLRLLAMSMPHCLVCHLPHGDSMLRYD